MIHSCGIIINFDEMLRSESLEIVSDLIIKTNKLTDNKFKFAVYDNGCHLGELVESKIKNVFISDIKFVIDRFHQYNHTRNICKTKYSCDLYKELKDLNSEICEQKFSHLLKYKTISKHMGMYHYNFFYLCLFTNFNLYNNIMFEKKLNNQSH